MRRQAVQAFAPVLRGVASSQPSLREAAWGARRWATSSATLASASSSSSQLASEAASAGVTPSPSDVKAYRYAPTAVTRKRGVVQDGQAPPHRDAFLRSSRGLMATVNAQLRAQYDPDGTRTALLARKSRQNVISGSILNVETWNDASRTTFSSFAGVVLAMRHRNTSSSITLRNIVNKTGVEVTFNLYSPLIKDIKVIARAHTSKREGALRRVRRAKLYYLRDNDKRLPNVARAIQVARAREERERQAADKTVENAAKAVASRSSS